MVHHYTLFIDEAGDDKVDRLRPSYPNGNSEWLCIGGYLIRSELAGELAGRRDAIRQAIGGQAGQPLHYRDINSRNRLTAATMLAAKTSSAKGYVVCSYKRTMLGYRNPRAEEVLGGQHKDTLYNYNCRLLLERVTNFVWDHGRQNGISHPLLNIVMASRKGHHFGQFKTYVMDKLVPQAIGGSTYQNTREIRPDVLRRDLISRAVASHEPGLQLADTMVSAFFQSLESLSPHHKDKAGLVLRPLMARQVPRYRGQKTSCAREGVTLYHPDAAKLLSREQTAFFEEFGYDMAYLASRKATKKHRPPQAQRLWTNEAARKQEIPEIIFF